MSKVENITLLYKDIMDVLEIPVDDNSSKTPERIARMLLEIFENINKDPMQELIPQISTFPALNSNIITVKDIPFVSSCAHHHFPFMGMAKVTYTPKNKIIGLSKIPRVIEWFCKKPQLQEYLTKEIGEFLVKIIEPAFLTVELYNVTHTCASCRGVRSKFITNTKFKYTEEDL